MEESKEFSDYVILNSLTREKGDTKEFKRLVLGEFFLAKGEGNEKDEQHKFCFQGLENQKTLESFLQRKKKNEFKEIQKSIGKSLLSKELLKIFSKILEMQIKALLLQTLHVWSREPLEEL